jgi:hypothetical protein
MKIENNNFFFHGNNTLGKVERRSGVPGFAFFLQGYQELDGDFWSSVRKRLRYAKKASRLTQGRLGIGLDHDSLKSDKLS